ncbi:MAG: zf-TFIIB domain-containing protein [Candidatus Hydrogenedentes bacterium]|nr:zf-TFIIB domain-containing protein [Candidatus Hydrogenedentota bacterium]
MDCPVCKKPMIVLECADVEVDFCVACEGVWLDSGEIELLFGDARACAEFLSVGSPANAHGEKKRRCPICRARMSKEATESDPPVLYDRCPNGDGLWFDKGELGEVIKHGKMLKGRDEVSRFLRDVFVADNQSDDSE